MNSGLMPPPPPSTTGGGTSAGGGGGGGASVTGRTEPAEPCAPAAAAEPHIAAAGAPWVIAVRTAHGSACAQGAGARTAAVAPSINEPAATTPRIPPTRWIFISSLRHHGATTPHNRET